RLLGIAAIAASLISFAGRGGGGPPGSASDGGVFNDGGSPGTDGGFPGGSDGGFPGGTDGGFPGGTDGGGPGRVPPGLLRLYQICLRNAPDGGRPGAMCEVI